MSVTRRDCGYLLTRRRSAEALTLAAGFAITEIAMQVMKRAVERPRPPDALVDTDGYSYPSGHAALSVTYLAMRCCLSRTAPPAARVAMASAGLCWRSRSGSRAYICASTT